MLQDEVITKIVNSMMPILDADQIQQLKDTLYLNLYNYEVYEKCTDVAVYEQNENEKYLELFLAAKRISNRKERTIQYYREEIKMLLERLDKPVTQIQSMDIGYFLAEYKVTRKVSAITLDNARRVYNSFFSWLVTNDYIVKNPVAKIEKGKQDKIKKKAITEEEMELVRQCCKDIRELAMIDVLYCTGVRVSEFCSMNRSDIDWNQRQLNVIGKGRKERTVFLSASALVNLRAYLNSRTDEEEALFVSKNCLHKRLYDGGVRIILKKIGQKAGVHLNPHKFRRTLATRLLNRGMKLEYIKEVLGHEKMETTLIYCELSRKEVRNEYDKYI